MISDANRQTPSTEEAVRACAIRAKQSCAALERAADTDIDAALRGMAERLPVARHALVSANEEDLAAAVSAGMSPALQDRLRLTGPRLEAMAAELRTLADVAHEPRNKVLEERSDGLTLLERRRPVGVIGANFEARPNVTLDIASQFLKSRNAGVLRTGSAALRSSRAVVEQVIAPALREAGLDPDAIQLVPSENRSAAYALVSLPELIPLVILRGSGESTRDLGREAARHGVRTLAHADGGGVLYVDSAADDKAVHQLIADSLDRLGVCNRLNLLLIDQSVYDERLPGILQVLNRLGITASLPPHTHPRGYEWSLDPKRAATAQFIDAYTGSGVFWNSTTRLLDGFKLLRLPEIGINIDRVPGPRGPVSFRDLHLRQYMVVPSERLTS